MTVVETPKLPKKMIELPTTNIILKQYNRDAEFSQVLLNSCLIDSGTSDCLVSSSCLFSSNFLYDHLGQKLSISNALNQKSDNVIQKMVHVNLKLPDFNLELVNVGFFVVEGTMSYPAIIGMNVISRLVIDFRTSKFRIANTWSNKLMIESASTGVIQSNNTKIFHPHAVAASECVFGPFEESFIECNILNCEIFNDTEELQFLTSNSLTKNALSGWPKFHKKRNLMKLKNMSDKPVIIEKGAYLGILNSVRNDKLLPDELFTTFSNFLVKLKNLPIEEQEIHESELSEWFKRRNKLVKEISLKAERDSVLNKVPIEFREELAKLLLKYDWQFSRSKNDSGLSQTFLVDLKLKPDDCGVPSFSRPYPCRDPELTKMVNKKIENMKIAGILERANSPWNSPLLAVKKRNGDLRLVNNFSCGLNSRLLSGHYPIAPIRMIFSKISEFISIMKKNFPNEIIYMSVFDVRNGYYTLGIRESCRDLTAFIASSEQVRFKRLSQGLSLAPSDFSLFMAEVFGGLGTKKSDNFTVFNYLDDYCLLAPKSSHFKALATIFERAKQNNLVLALSKCSFFMTEMDFLGFKVTNSGYEVARPRVQTLLDLPYPQTKKQAQQFSATFNFYMRCVPRMSFLFRPLHDAISAKKFILTDEIKNLIDQLKNNIRSGIAVSHLSYEKPIFVACDSSLLGVGFSMGNFNSETEDYQDVSYSHFGSKAFDEIERNLSSRSRELLGLSHCLESFKDLIPAGLSFTCYVDHKSLENIFSRADLGKTSYITRVRNAYGVVLNFNNMKIKHLPGRSTLIGLVDGISRLAIQNTSVVHAVELNPEIKDFEISSNLLRFSKPNILREDIVREQKNDPHIFDIFSELHESEEKSLFRNKIEYLLIRNLVYRKTNDGSLLLMIPENLAKLVLEFLHCSTFHRGSAALTDTLMRTPIFIRNRTKLIAEVTRECLYCQISVSGKFRDQKDENMPMRPSLEPFAKISIDLVQFGTSENSWYALTFFCCFSKYLDIEILQNKSAKVVTEALVLLMLRHGCQNTAFFSHDNGKEFDNALFREIMEEMNCYHSSISPYNSRSSAVERCHREIRGLMRSLENIKNERYRLKLAVCAYNNLPVKSLDHFSPRQVLCGLEPAPLLKEFSVGPDGPEVENCVGARRDATGSDGRRDSFSHEPEISQENRENWAKFVLNIRLKLGIEKYKDFKEKQDQNISQKFEIGDLVLIKDPIFKMSKVINSGIKGPFVVESRNLNSYTVRNLIDNRPFVRNGRHLKKLVLSKENSELLRKQHFQIKNDNTISPISEEVKHEGALGIEGLINSKNKNQVQSKYFLRKRS